MTRIINWFRPYAGYVLAGYVIFILTLSSIPSIPTLKIHTPKAEIRLDYLVHFCEYGILAALTYIRFSGNFLPGTGRILLMIICLLAFAAADEFHQKIIPGRSFNYFDMLSNGLGAITGIFVSYLVFRILNRKRSLDPIS